MYIYIISLIILLTTVATYLSLLIHLHHSFSQTFSSAGFTFVREKPRPLFWCVYNRAQVGK